MTTSPHIATGCEWKADAEGNWETGCGKTYCIIEGGPIENEMQFCCFCGLSLDELPYKDGPDPDEDQECAEESFDVQRHD